jgi:hypothetical protein
MPNYEKIARIILESEHGKEMFGQWIILQWYNEIAATIAIYVFLGILAYAVYKLFDFLRDERSF